MTALRYPPASLYGDYLRSGLGLAVCLGIVLLAAPGPWISAILLGLSGVFLLFAYRTYKRQSLCVIPKDEGLTVAGREDRQIVWDRLSKLRLRYYGTQRDRTKGKAAYFELTLETPDARLSLESTLEGFSELLWHAARAAHGKGLSLDDTTTENLRALGIDPASGRTPPLDPAQDPFQEAG